MRARPVASSPDGCRCRTASGSGISVGAAGDLTHTVTIVDNTIARVGGFAGIDVSARQESVVNATIVGNAIGPIEGFALAGIQLLAGGGPADTSTICTVLRDNRVDAGSGALDILVDQVSPAARYRFPGYAGSPSSGADLAAFLANQNRLFGGGVDATNARNVNGGECR